MDASLLRDSCLLAADAEDIGKIIAVAIPILIGIGSAVIGALQKKAKPPAPARRPPRPPGQPAPAGGGPTPADEVEEFLRRVAQRRGDKAAKAEAARPAAPRAKPVAPPTPPDAPPRAKPIGADVQQHVEQALDSRKFSERASQLTTVDRADESMSDHVKSVFEHRIGQFQTETITDEAGSVSAETAAAPRVVEPSPAQQLAQLLASPDGMRQAVLLGEVLRRPTHRWG
jgi:hypothetical protein